MPSFCMVVIRAWHCGQMAMQFALSVLPPRLGCTMWCTSNSSSNGSPHSRHTPSASRYCLRSTRPRVMQTKASKSRTPMDP